MATTQATMLYAAELTWKGMEGECQAAIKRMGREAIGAFSTTPLGIVAGESALTPARALLDPRPEGFSQRLLARLEVGGEPDETLGR